MARINIEPEWWSDMRRMQLVLLLGNEFSADGMVFRAWRLAQQFWFKKELIPDHAWVGSGFGDELFKCGLAERRQEGIYVRGATRHFDWYEKKVEVLRQNASKGGKNSAKSRKTRNGTAQPSKKTSKQTRTEVEANSSRSNPSSSSSSSSSKETPIVPLKGDGIIELEKEFQRFSSEYKRIFPTATIGQKAWIRFQEQFGRDPDSIAFLWRALPNYERMLKAEDWRRPKTSVETFLGSKRSGFFWRDFIDVVRPVHAAGSMRGE
jgi:hypothetical protein